MPQPLRLPALDPATVAEVRALRLSRALPLPHGRPREAQAGRRLRAHQIRRQPRDARPGRPVGAAALAHARGRIRLRALGRGRARHQRGRAGADAPECAPAIPRARRTPTTSSIAAARRPAISKSATAHRATTRSIRTTTSCGSRTRTASTRRTRTAAAIGARLPFVAPPGRASGDFRISSAAGLTAAAPAPTFHPAAKCRRSDPRRLEPWPTCRSRAPGAAGQSARQRGHARLRAVRDRRRSGRCSRTGCSCSPRWSASPASSA